MVHAPAPSSTTTPVRVNLYSDTQTKPTRAMKLAMMDAEVGDDQAGTDPTINALNRRMAELLGKEAAVFLPSGTMCNEIAILTQCRPGDEILGHKTCHILHSEGGAPWALAGVQVTGLDGENGIFGVPQLEEALRAKTRNAPPQRMVEVEQTANLGGGAVWSLDALGEVADWSHRHGLVTHMDGARLMNAVVESGVPAREMAAGWDTVWLDFTKGLGAPLGAVLAGTEEFIGEAWRWKQRVGGAMRQGGICAAACLYALDHHVERLAEDHAKWVTQVDEARRIPEIVAHGVDVATSGRPGPVVIALSEEMQKTEAVVSDLGPVVVSCPQPDAAAVARLDEMLGRAQRPLAVLGGSGWSDAGRAAVREALVARDVPVAVAFRRQGLYDGTLPNFAGDLGVGSDPALVAKAREADLVLALGTRLGEAVTQGYTLFTPDDGGTAIVHVYPDRAEIGRVFRPTLGIACDLDAFARTWAARPAAPGGWGAWTRELRALREAGREVPDYPGPLNVAACLRALEELAEPDAIFTTDAGNFAAWPSRFLNYRDGQRVLGPCNGAMGYGVPAAIGAKVLYPERQVIAFVGDGGMLMTGQEIATAFHHGVAPIVLVFNNGMYGTIRMYQERAYPGRVSGTALTNPDFARLIEAFDGHGEVVQRTEEFASAFRRAAASGKPALIELRMDAEQITSRATVAQLRAGTGPKPVPKRVTAKRPAMRKAGRV